MNVEDLTLGELQSRAEALASAWNGKDKQFQFEGELRHENDAMFAQDLLDKIDSVGIMFSSLNL